MPDTLGEGAMQEERCSHKRTTRQTNACSAMCVGNLGTLPKTAQTKCKQATGKMEKTHIHIDNTEDAPMWVGFVQAAFLQQFGYKLDSNRIYLDTCSMFSLVARKEYLKDMCKFGKGLTAYCNSGQIYTDLKEKLGSIDIRLKTMAKANILSFTELKKNRISYNKMDTGGEFMGHTPVREIWFKCNNLGLPYISLKDS